MCLVDGLVEPLHAYIVVLIARYPIFGILNESNIRQRLGDLRLEIAEAPLECAAAHVRICRHNLEIKVFRHSFDHAISFGEARAATKDQGEIWVLDLQQGAQGIGDVNVLF